MQELTLFGNGNLTSLWFIYIRINLICQQRQIWSTQTQLLQIQETQSVYSYYIMGDVP